MLESNVSYVSLCFAIFNAICFVLTLPFVFFINDIIHKKYFKKVVSAKSISKLLEFMFMRGCFLMG